MIQCIQCELCEMGPDGRRMFKCDPFSNIKEPECIAKWQLIRLDMLLASYQSMHRWQKEMEPMQRKMMKFVEREMTDIDESDKWKIDEEEPPVEGPGVDEDEGHKPDDKEHDSGLQA